MDNRIDFIKSVVPFNVLPADVLEGIAPLLQEVVYGRETMIYKQESTTLKSIDLIAEGGYESFFYDSSQNKRLAAFYGPGQCYGGVSLLVNRKKSLRTVIAKKGTRVYALPRKAFRELCQSYDVFFHYFTDRFGKKMLNEEYAHFFKRPTSFEENFIATDRIYSRRIENVEYREIVACTADTPIFETARSMAEHKVSCSFVKDHNGRIIGYITDITLRDKVVARGTDVRQPISTVMDNPIVTISRQAFVYEAILMMFRTKTRYLLVEENGQYKGFLSRNRLLSEQAHSPLVFIQSVKSALSVEELKRKWEAVPQIVTQLLGRGVNAEIVNQVITTVADTISLKVIEDEIEKAGPPPARFCFMVLGSEGRKEQTLKTDQDNAIIYEDKANEHREEVRAYFLQLAEAISEKLNYIGFSYCTGGFMAKNSKWTHSLSHWKRNYRNWMEESVPDTAMKFSTFFDCRFLYGEQAIMDELKAFLDEELQKPMETFLFHIARNALQYEPPLTFFKNIRTTTRGAEEVFDVKRAMTPIVDLVRVYALENRIFEANTGERLKALKEKGVFSDTEFHELMQSYYLLMRLRLNKQARQIIHDKTEPDNFVNIRSITKIEVVTLKEIFKTIENFQNRIKVRWTSNILR